MAHRCWAVDDIVNHIIAILVRDNGKASAVALASCSKSLEEPALREVWRRLEGLAPLVKCFPPEVWEIRERKLFFKRAPFEAEWTRFQERYASKVQHLRVFSYISSLSLTALHILQLFASDPLLPNLVSLEWYNDEDVDYVPFVSAFFSPSLMSIELNIPRKASFMLPPVFKRLSTLSPDIRDIDINIETDDDSDEDHQPYHDDFSLEEATSKLMHCNHHLRKFQVDSPIPTSALRHVLQLPFLEDVRLVSPIRLPDPLPSLVFPSIRKLDVHCNGDPTWLKLLPAVESPALTTISVMSPNVKKFMKAFQLTVTGCGMHEILQGFTVQSPEVYKITPQIIACCLSFKNLTSLMLSSECSGRCSTSDLRDDDIDLLTKAMPCLEDLAIGDIPCDTLSQITFKSLYNISRRCTRITELTIHFNPGPFVENISRKSKSWHVALGLSDPQIFSSDLCQITTFNVGGIPFPERYNSTCILALGLLGVFPRLEEIDYAEENDDWEQVYLMIKVCRQMGSSAFSRVEELTRKSI